MVPKGWLWRLVLAAVVILILWWLVPAIIALIVIVAPPVAPALGPISMIIRGALMLWGGIYVLTGKGGPIIP